jgi:prepilin-type N-terminal cleavage/methylation domain-containing protein
MNKAFTLIEILLVISIIAFIIGFSIYIYSKISQSTFLVEETANLMVNVLNLARDKAIIAEENDNWGVLLVNTTTDYLILFRGNENNIKQRHNLVKEVSFFDFTTKTIIFRKITGTTSPEIIKIGLSRGINFKYLKISTSGNITVSNTP